MKLFYKRHTEAYATTDHYLRAYHGEIAPAPANISAKGAYNTCDLPFLASCEDHAAGTLTSGGRERRGFFGSLDGSSESESIYSGFCLNKNKQ